MKKVYLSLFTVLLTAGAFAQVKSNLSPLVKRGETQIGATKFVNQETEKATVLWSDNFSTGANWTIANLGSNTEDWSISTNPAVIPVAALAPFASASAANGFLFVNSDANNTADFNSTIINTTATNVTPINLAGQPFVKLRFSHNFRWWHDTRGVRVSGDNGATWTEFEITNETEYSTPNQNSDNPHVSVFDISAVAGNQTQVLVQFYYNDNDYWAWYWAVDDVQIETFEDYDLTLNTVDWGTTGYWAERLPYYQIPSAQIQPIEFAGKVKNNGLQTQSDVVFEVGTSTGFTGTSAMATIASNATDSLELTTQWTPSTTVGSATVSFDVTSGATDDFTADNSIADVTVATTGFIYARDAGTITNGTFNQGEEFKVGNIFDMYAGATLKGIDVFISASAVAGAEVTGTLWSIDETDGSFVFMEETNAYVLTAGDLGALKTLKLLTDQTLDADLSYLVTVGSFGDGGATNDLVVGTAGVSGVQTSYYYDGTDLTWYYTTSTPMVRMNFNPALGLEESAFAHSMNLYPNPANNSTTVAFELENAAVVALNVTDITGKVVATQTINAVGGANQTIIDASKLTSGVYFVNLSANGEASTQKLIVRK
ncbi:MAG: T9SS type A sorting domain-containing protein [Bacteroidota bacterium]